MKPLILSVQLGRSSGRMDKSTFRERALIRANKTGLSHYVCRHWRTGKFRIFRHGQIKPWGWRELTKVMPDYPSDKDDAINRILHHVS